MIIQKHRNKNKKDPQANRNPKPVEELERKALKALEIRKGPKFRTHCLQMWLKKLPNSLAL